MNKHLRKIFDTLSICNGSRLKLFSILLCITTAATTYGMDSKKIMLGLPCELQNIILDVYFNRQLCNMRNDNIWCRPNGYDFCPERCFIHKMSAKERMDEITGTLQLALTFPNCYKAQEFIIWYELGRIRQYPHLVEKMDALRGWKDVFFCTQYYKRKEEILSKSIIDNIQEQLCRTLLTYQAPLKEHIFYATIMSGYDSTNIMPATQFYDFSLLLQPTVTIPIEKNNNGVVWLNTQGDKLVHHANNGHSIIYDIQQDFRMIFERSDQA